MHCLIEMILADPVSASDKGVSYELADEYLGGAPLDSLRDLLTHANQDVRRVGTEIAEELGIVAVELLPVLVQRLSDEDIPTVYYTIESVAVCADGDGANEYRHVVLALESPIEIIRRLCTRLVSRASESQIAGAIASLDSLSPRSMVHARGLTLLQRQPQANTVESFLRGNDALMRKYAAIAAFRTRQDIPGLFELAKVSDDEEIRQFANDP